VVTPGRGETMKYLLSGILVLSFLLPPRALADDFPPGDDQITALSAGQRAPFDGQLFSTDTAIRWGFRLERLRLELDESVLLEQRRCAVQINLLETRLELEDERREYQLTLLRDALAAERALSEDLATRLSDAQDVPWYESWGFAYGMGVLSAVLVGGVTALIISYTK